MTNFNIETPARETVGSHSSATHSTTYKNTIPVYLPREDKEHTSKRILLIDDDPYFGSAVSTMAHSLGMDLVHRTSFWELGDASNLEQFDLAIVDFNLEGMNGFEIAHLIDDFELNLPVIIVSGNRLWQTQEWLWPKSLKRVMSKSQGIPTLLRTAHDFLKKDEVRKH